MTCLFSGIDLPRTPMANHIWQCEVCKTAQANQLRQMKYLRDDAACVHVFELDQALTCRFCGHTKTTARVSCSGARYHIQPLLLVLPNEKPHSPSGSGRRITLDPGPRTQILPHGG